MKHHHAIRCVGPHDEPYAALPGAYLCHGCTEQLRKAVAEFPAQVLRLRAVVATGGSGGEPVSGSPGIVLPVRPGIVDLEVEIAERLASWCRLVAEDRGLQAPPLPRSGPYAFRTRDVTGLATWLLEHVDWLASQPFADEVLAELGDVASRAGAAVRPQDRRRFPLGRDICPDCGEPLTVVLTRDETYVRCDAGHRWDATQFRALGHRLLKAVPDEPDGDRMGA